MHLLAGCFRVKFEIHAMACSLQNILVIGNIPLPRLSLLGWASPLSEIVFANINLFSVRIKASYVAVSLVLVLTM
jgi:hypothetical protein